LTVCPCCGFRFEGDLREGCVGCGARAVGPPLARPEYELPSYGRALLVGAAGLILLLSFTASTIIALFETTPLTIGFWPLVSAAETAAWRLKFLALPMSVAVAWGGWLIYLSIRRETLRFAGHDFARFGLAASALVAVMIAAFIGVTVPERLRQRQRGLEAAVEAQGYTLQRALLEYRLRYKTYPTSFKDLQDGLPDRNGSLAAALSNIDPSTYIPSANVADASTAKPSRLRGAALRRVSTNTSTDDSVNERISFTNYTVRLPGADKIPNTDDDWLMRDGVLFRPSKSGPAAAAAPSGASALP
jgi:type II secretory pathway pseudopilin PulG